MSSQYRCPITYQISSEPYSLQGLRQLSPKLKKLEPLRYTVAEQIREAQARASKMSIQGAQPKISARLSVKTGEFVLADSGGTYILKPPHMYFPELPANEGISMHLAKTIGIRCPVSGLIMGKDGSWTYFIKRFDRYGRGKKRQVEDFAQLSLHTRDSKYASRMERVAAIVDQHCSFPMIEKEELGRRTIFSFLIGNEDMHLKNFSLITVDHKIELSPAYDLLNTTIALANPQEELALPLNGKKRNLTLNDFLKYFLKTRLGLSDKTIKKLCDDIQAQVTTWPRLLQASYLSDDMKESYLNLLAARYERLFPGSSL